MKGHLDITLNWLMFNSHQIETNKVNKEHYLIRKEYNILMFYKIIIFKYRTKKIKATETNK